MAVLSRIKCTACGYTKEVMHSPADAPPTICGPCATSAAEAEKQTALDALASLSTEERLRRIEAWIYDHSRKYHAPHPARF